MAVSWFAQSLIITNKIRSWEEGHLIFRVTTLWHSKFPTFNIQSMLESTSHWKKGRRKKRRREETINVFCETSFIVSNAWIFSLQMEVLFEKVVKLLGILLLEEVGQSLGLRFYSSVSVPLFSLLSNCWCDVTKHTMLLQQVSLIMLDSIPSNKLLFP